MHNAKNMLRSLFPETRSTIPPVGGIITLSMTWTIPFEAFMSNLEILEPSTVIAYIKIEIKKFVSD